MACGRRILRSHAGRAGLRPNFAVLNEDEQWRLLLRHYDDVFGPEAGRAGAGGLALARAAPGDAARPPILRAAVRRAH